MGRNNAQAKRCVDHGIWSDSVHMQICSLKAIVDHSWNVHMIMGTTDQSFISSAISAQRAECASGASRERWRKNADKEMDRALQMMDSLLDKCPSKGRILSVKHGYVLRIIYERLREMGTLLENKNMERLLELMCGPNFEDETRWKP